MNREGYCSLNELFLGTQRFRSFRTALDAAIRLTDLFCRLHERDGHVRAFRAGDVSIHPESGQLMVLRGDLGADLPAGGRAPTEEGTPAEERAPAERGLAAEGETLKSWEIQYMPPELVSGRREADIFSDRFLLGVLLFRILAGGTHPLAGRRSVRPVMTQEMKRKLYGTEPLFMFDPDNDGNGPDPKLHRETKSVWGILPEWIREAFLQTFGEGGLHNPEDRPGAADWMEGLIRFQNEMVPCDCGSILFDQGENSLVCSRCGQEIPINYRIRLEERQIPAVRGNRLYRKRAGGGWNPQPAARLVGSHSEPRRMGIQNISGDSWEAVTTKGKVREVQPDDVIPLKDGIVFRYDSSIISIAETKSAGEK